MAQYTVGFVSVLVLVLAFGFGLVIGRWWALLAAVPLGAWVGFTDTGDMEHWFAGVLSGIFVAFPIMVGLLVRRSLQAIRDRGHPTRS
jgi:hypothetical protein